MMEQFFFFVMFWIAFMAGWISRGQVRPERPGYQLHHGAHKGHPPIGGSNVTPPHREPVTRLPIGGWHITPPPPKT